MRILIVVEPGIDGVFRHVEGLIHHLLAEKQEVHLAYSDRRGSVHLEKLTALVAARGGECLNLRTGNAPEPGDLSALARLWALARRLRPEVVHGHSSKAGVLVRTLPLLGIRARFFYSPHAYYGLAPRPGKAVHFYNAVERLFGRIGTTVNISNDEAAFATGTLRIPRGKIRIIHNPVDTAVFRPATPEERRQRRSALGFPEDAVVLGALGRLSFQKDPQTLYRAIAPVLRARKDIVLCHCGQGELDGELRLLSRELGIEDQIVRRAYFDEPAEFYQALDGFALTSRYEAGWPIVVLEALATDLPLIVSDAPGTTDIGAAGLSHCWTAPAGQVASFTAAVESWLADRPAGRPSNHRQTAIGRFSPVIAYGAVLDAYREAE
jgi:glycosyltransferase involved in cell wall biosynthesis